jgi:hypothetical protein
MSGELLCIIPGPTKELAREADGVRWCFGCRKHLVHDWVLYGDEGPSYYDPEWICECSGCGKDRTDFPGRVRFP